MMLPCASLLCGQAVEFIIDVADRAAVSVERLIAGVGGHDCVRWRR